MTVSAQQIEKDLTDLWSEGPDDKTKGLGLQRVYTTNLVGYASGHEEGYRVEQIMNDLAEKHPGRYILIRPAADPTEPPLRHYVMGHCFFGAGKEKRVCCDIIKLVAQKEVIENLYGFTFSLLLPDLPLEFWWPGDLPHENPFFERVAGQANRVWVDSSKFKDPVASLSRLAAFWESRFPNTLLMDLNWIRIQRWRALIAELFDGEWSGYLKDVNKVSVAYGQGSSPTRGFFLACWLASRLGWRYEGQRIEAFPPQLDFVGPKGKVEVILQPVPVQDAKRDRIFAVGLTTGGDPAGIFTAVRDQDPHCVIARSEIGGKTALVRTVTFDHLHSNELLATGLKHLRPDTSWDKALKMAGTILAKPDLTKV
jgi:glucose-6-phosphate dehydrogenase assembly protein OpcA